MNNLKALRLSRGLTQIEMGHAIGLSGKHVGNEYSRIERGVRQPTRSQQIIIDMLLSKEEMKK